MKMNLNNLNIPSMINKLVNKPMYIHDDSIIMSLCHRLCDIQSKKITSEDIEEYFYEMPEPYDYDEETRVIPVQGIINYNLSNVEKWLFGAVDLNDIKEEIKAVKNNDKYKQVVFHFDSGGGGVTHLSETAQAIMDLGQYKDTAAYTSTWCCSAAQYLAAACNQTYATPSSDLGSINAIMARFDVSEMYAQMGIKAHVFTGGDLKSTFWEISKLSDSQEKYLHETVQKCAEEFKTYMRERIPGIKDEDMRGQSLSGQEMFDKGYIEYLVSDFEEIFQ